MLGLEVVSGADKHRIDPLENAQGLELPMMLPNLVASQA